MSEVTPVCIPQETVNDDHVLIQQWKVADGQAVQAGQILVEVETSKSVFEITSPSGGFIRLNATSDQEVPIGKILCYIGESLEAVDASLQTGQRSVASVPRGPVANGGSRHSMTSEPASTPSSGLSATFSPSQGEKELDEGAVFRKEQGPDEFSVPAQSTRFSRLALELIEEHGLSADGFTGQGLVRSEDIYRAMAMPESASPKPLPVDNSRMSISAEEDRSRATHQFRSAAGVPFRCEPLARSKRLETKVLSWSTQQAIRSSVTVMVPTSGRHELQERDCDVTEKITANLIQASAQLLRQFPLLNACCIDDQVMVYEQVNIGYALDAGHGLKVAVLRDADQKTVPDIVEERQRLIAAYLNESMLPADLGGATFTITDLSGSGVATFDPIISEGQAGILGIGGEFPIGAGQSAFHLVLSFDHRLVEGRTAAMFLNLLRDEVTLFEQSLLTASSSLQGSSEACCARCGMTVSGAAQRNHFLVSVAGVQNSSSLLCTICLQGR